MISLTLTCFGLGYYITAKYCVISKKVGKVYMPRNPGSLRVSRTGGSRPTRTLLTPHNKDIVIYFFCLQGVFCGSRRVMSASLLLLLLHVAFTQGKSRVICKFNTISVLYSEYNITSVY